MASLNSVYIIKKMVNIVFLWWVAFNSHTTLALSGSSKKLAIPSDVSKKKNNAASKWKETRSYVEEKDITIIELNKLMFLW